MRLFISPAGLPSTVRLPWQSGKRPSSALIIVVLPVPLVPTMAVTEPVGMAKVPCCQMIWSPRLMAASLNTMQSEVSLITPDCGKRC